MKYKYLVIPCVISSCLTTVSEASKPEFSIVPTGEFFTRPNQVLGFDGTGFIHYIVTNNSQRLHSFTVTLPKGVSQNIPDIIPRSLPLCINKQKTGLGVQESCLLTLKATASIIEQGNSLLPLEATASPSIKASATGGPIISIGTNGYGRFQPSPSDSLSISVSPLSTSVTGLALSVNDVIPPFYALTGTPRKITLTSGGSNVSNVTFTLSPSLPGDTSISPSNQNCGTISPGNPCVITITPGSTATTSSSILTVFENGTASFTIPIDILTYGSLYQSGYVFAIDDTTSDTMSVGGKAAATQNQAPLFPFGIIWASNGLYTCKAGTNNAFAPCTNYAVIPGINELSTQPTDACNGSTDGACDTQVIVNYLDTHNPTTPGTPVDRTKYAAGLCTVTIIDGYSGWYLPAICELGYFQADPNTPDAVNNCGSPTAPLLQNMASNLTNSELATVQGPFWSSTEYSGTDGSTDNAWDNYFTSNTQTHDGKEDTVGVRCVRALTQPPPT